MILLCFLSADIQDVHCAAVRGPGCWGDEVCCSGDFLPNSAPPPSEPQTNITADSVPDQHPRNQSKRSGFAQLTLHLTPFLYTVSTFCQNNPLQCHCWDNPCHRSEGRQRLCMTCFSRHVTTGDVIGRSLQANGDGMMLP